MHQRPRSLGTIAAAVLVVAVSLPFGIAAVDFGRVVFTSHELGQRARSEVSTLADMIGGGSQGEVATLMAIGFWSVALITLYALALAYGILRRQQWARYGAILSFLFFGLLMLPLAVAGLTADPPSSGAWLGVVLGLGDLAVVALLLSHQVSDDFGDAEWLRQRERHPTVPPDPTQVLSRR